MLLADDHQIVRQGVRALLEDAGHVVVGEAADGREACQLARRLQPDIAVLDLSMPILNGVDAAREIRRVSPRTRAIVLTMYTERPFVLQAMQAGARGYVVKSQAAEDLIQAIREVLSGAAYLSPAVSALLLDAYRDRAHDGDERLTARERAVLQLIGEGKTTKAIAGVLGISFKTAESHRSRVMKKLDIHQVAGLVRYAIRRGLLRA
ncbi:MAG TPA: response regulator transcription factor [Burkholderiales bacterium]|nr:response regulator transcription factor [Burkholderiales bacterium]